MRASPVHSGDQLKQMAMFVNEVTGKDFLELMRTQAQFLCLKFGQVTTDDLREYADSIGVQPPHKNIWGRVLTEDLGVFKVVGFQKSRWRSNRSRRICIWALV